MMNHQTRLLVGGAIIAAVMIAFGLIRTAGAGPAGLTLVVDEQADIDTGGCDPTGCTLREAVELANDTPGHDTIVFDPAVFPPNDPNDVILYSPLTKIEADQGITIDGTGTAPVIVAYEVVGNEHEAGLYFRTNPGVVARDIVVRNITIDYFATGIRVCSGEVAFAPPTEPVCGYNAENVSLENVTVLGSNGELDEVGIVVEGANLSEINLENASVHQAWFNAVVVEAGNNIDGLVISGGEQESGEFGLIVDAVNALTDVTIEGALVSGDRAIVLDAASADDVLIRGNTAEGGVFFAGMGENNRIVDNELYNAFDRDGVAVGGGRVTISRNSIYGNDRLGINLFTNADPVNGVTPNDAGDTDSGPNDLLNFPVLNGAAADFVTGTACADCLVELFLVDSDPSGYGEGKTFLQDATADGSGNFAVSICGLSVVAGNQVTATATDGLGNTSEFSLNYTLPLTPGACPSPSPTPTASPSPTPTSTPVATPSPTVTQSPTPTQTATATPSPTATSSGGDAAWGDSDCNGQIGARDNQALLRLVLSQTPLSQTEPCPDLGEQFGGRIWGDWDCSGAIGARDNQALLRHVLSQPPLSQTEPCPDIGTQA